MERAAYNLVGVMYPYAVIYSEDLIMISSWPVRTRMQETIPDLLVYLPDSYCVIMEVTGSPFMQNDDPKDKQKELYRAWTAIHPDYRWLVLYLQNFSSAGSVIASLNLIQKLARGARSEKIEKEANRIARDGQALRQALDPIYLGNLEREVAYILSGNSNSAQLGARVNGNAKRKFV